VSAPAGALSARVSAILLAPVKGLRALAREKVELGPGGVRENRRFLLIDEHGQMANGKRIATLQAAVAEYSDAERTLSLTLPGRPPLRGAVELGARLQATMFSRPIEVAEVLGPWSAALSDHAGTPLRLVEAASACGAVDRGAGGPISLIARASVARIAQQAEREQPLDPRRFRMLFEIDGVEAHAEDAWVGRALAIGDATVMARGHVGRCAVTMLDPDSGRRDFDTLAALTSYRRDVGTTEPLACGIYGVVLEPGAVRVGDAVTPL
jgi:uncharacterized protein YcbX